MKKHYFFVSLLALALSMPRSSFASVQSADSDDGIVVTLGAPKVSMQLMAAQSSVTQSHMVINGTGQSGTFILNAQNLVEDIKLTATSGLEVYPATLPAGSNGETIIITLNSTLPVTEGRIILRSGDARAYVNVTGYGTPLEEKNLSQNPVYPGGDDESFVKGKEDGFTPGENGYTVEFRVKTDNLNKVFEAFAVTPEGAGFKAYVNSTSVGLYDGSTQVNIPNPATAFDGGLQHFYNNDGKYHTYRFSVTSDQRIFVYRDGLQIAILRASDYANQASWTVENGDMVENLLKNPDFEGEYDYRASDSLIVRVEGWQLDPIDQYNCLYTVPNYEINNELDFNNHVMSLQRYTWNDGWAAGRVSQIVDVAPNETYSLSFLAGGGMKVKDSAIDYLMSSVRIEEVQNSELNNKVEISNMDGMVSYSMDYTTSAECRQIRVSLYNERFLNGGGWGSSVRPFRVDEMRLTGVSRVLTQEVGFDNTFADVEYFTYDPTGAYAPLEAVLSPSEKNVTIDGTNQTKTVKVSTANLRADVPLSVTASKGFSVYPEELIPNHESEVTITLNSTLPVTKGRIILRSGDIRAYVNVTGYGTPLEEKNLSQNPVYPGGDDESFVKGKEDGFTPGENGYTVEFRVKTDNLNKVFEAFAVTPEGAGFKAYVNSTSVGLYDGSTQVNIPNPATAFDGGLQHFYNNDGKYHTYRFSVTSDQRIFVYRDGLQIAILRASDYANQASWTVENGDMVENLLKNPDFEGEYDYRASDSLIVRVEGWQLDPIDQYNCLYTVPNYEINNELDFNNHVMSLQRYTWNDGWAAGRVSQIVDVAPNETYSLSFLAGGGMKVKDSAIDYLMSSVRIEEVQNSELNNKVEISNMDGMVSYSMDYTTSAECRQIRVSLYNERFLNGGGWGSSVRPFRVDEMRLTGVSRVLTQEVGFDNTFADVEYFTYDPTGAYAPLEPVFGGDVTGIEGTNSDAGVYGTVIDNWLTLNNVPESAKIEIYSSTGVLIAVENSYTSGQSIPLYEKGIYVCVVNDGTRKEIVKIVY
ncbi:T9SS type A sorting domain-containing protein [Bacteroides salyersiae]|uniref:T9SS type A sorting domain-containing protein n=2 Tax=Bacteroides salyersiae TaxID=291644 RepID=UPI001C388140|nr:T9SS type A sorting domain-containing protein [Bacteroides salyersiae]MBV4204158.1 T9SS type A sorting domain-containing protein [Bacteroides salyersiae]MCB6649269.1 T9SS type A sorting domain-containing protein [Bacteroides salyersiae]